MSLVQLITTLGSKDEALDLARAAVGARLAACGQVAGPMNSIYRWQGDLQESEEYFCIMKAPTEGLEALAAFVRERHPYDTPEITVVESLLTDDRYLTWAQTETVGPRSPAD